MGTEWRKGSAYPNGSTTRRLRERRLLVLAGRQRHLVTTAQLRELGYAKSTIHGRLAARRLHPTPFAGVHSLVQPPLDRLQTIKAAALACGPSSLPSHWSAAEVLGIAEPALLPVHITNPTGAGRGRSHIALHRSIVLPCDTAGSGKILCTSAARTVIDLAAIGTSDEVERVLIAADSLRILNRSRLAELLEGARGQRGIGTLRSIVAGEPVRARSDREVDMLQVCRPAGLPAPVVNGLVEGFEVDFHWPELRLVVELDSWRFHGGRERMNADRERDQRLTMAGWLVVRFTRDQLAAVPAECGRRLAALAERRTVAALVVTRKALVDGRRA
ncbi:MAG TPA: DUF559 domain-containing protein [Solirubrobacterales bacterium]|nr:DUF559 domain-containing protein [Solirubrobacterales bacterium]